MLPYGRHWIDDDDVRAVEAVLRGEWLTTGPAVAAFEGALAQRAGVQHAVVLNSGTAALHAAYEALGVGSGDEVIVPPLTFAATANAARFLGATVRFVDVDAETGTLDPEAVAAAITPRTKLMVPVDFAGHPADYDALHALASKYAVKVVADACHSLGATYRGRPVGQLADLSAFSFHPVKAITTGEGGAVVTNNAALAERVALFRSHGLVRDPKRLQEPAGAWHQEMQLLGYNYRLPDLQCALGLSQLRRLDQFVLRRRAIAARYNAAFGDLERLKLPQVRPDVESAWHLYVIRVCDAAERRPLFDRLRELGLGVQVHYDPVHHHPYYRQLGYDPGSCPNAVAFAGSAISLPLFPRMTETEVKLVIATVRKGVASL